MHMIQIIQINMKNNKGNKKGENGGLRKKEDTQWMETGQKHYF